MPYQSVRFSHHSRLLPTLLSLLTNRVFWAVISFFTNLAGFILVCSSAFLVDQFGRELKWSILTVFLVGIYIVPTLLFCTLLWGPQIKNKFQNHLLLRVVLIYFCFILVSVASHLNKYPRFHIKVEDEDSNSRKVYNLLSSGAFALTAMGLSRAIDLQFEVGFFFYFLEDAMEVSLGIIGKNGYKNWGYILATAIFCFLLIFLRCYLELIHERHSSNAISHRRTQPPDASTSTTNESMVNGDIETSQSRTTQVKANTNSNPTEASQSRIQIYSRASTVNEGSGQIETSSREESWLIDEDQWEIISPRVDMETSISSGESEDDEDVPSPRSTRSRVVKEDEDSTQLASTKPSSDEGTSGVGVDGDFNSKTTGSEDPGQEIVEKGDMRSPTSTVDMETSISSGESEDDEDVPPPRSTRSRVVKEDEDSTELASSKPSSSDEGTSGVGVDGDFNSKTTGSEDPGQEIVEQGDMRSPTLTVDMETSTSSGESEDDGDVPPPRSTRSKIVKEDEDSTQLASSKPSSSDEGTSGGGVGVDGDFNSRTKGSEDHGQEIVQHGDMRSPTPSVDMEKTISSDSGGYEKDDVSLLLSKIEGSVDQGQESGSQDSEKDDNSHLGLATNKPSSSDDEESGHLESHDHQSDCEELRDDTGEIPGGSADSEKVDVPLRPKIDITEGESRVVNTELGEREPKPQSRSTILKITRSRSSQLSWDMHLSNLHLDDSYLRTCRFCKLSLAPGHDIYMYRGDMAFCSLKCREQQMAQDERKEECKLACKKEAHCRSLPTSISTSNILYM